MKTQKCHLSSERESVSLISLIKSVHGDTKHENYTGVYKVQTDAPLPRFSPPEAVLPGNYHL